MLALTFGVAWLLLFRSEWLADKLSVPDQETQTPLSADAILGVGTRLLGIFFVVQATPELIGNLGRTISGVQQLMGVRDSMGAGVMGRMVFPAIWANLVAPALKLALGLLLALKTNTVLNWMNRKKETTEPNIGQVSSEAAPSATPDEPSM
jgi:hypothetical protein